MKPMRRGLLLSSAAIATGILATYLGDQHLQKRATEIEEELKADYATREVVVANRDLAAGERLTAASVALRDVPETYLPDTAIDASSWPQMDGGVITHPIGAGEPIITSQIRRSARSRLAEQITPGDRAITIPVSGTSAVSGLLEPGDRVDLMLTINEQEGRRTLPLLADVPIIATGAQMEVGDRHDRTVNYNDITLAVSSLEAAKITHAQVVGDIRPILRNDKDDEALPHHVIDRRTLLAGMTKDETRQPPQQKVELIIGGKH